MNGVDIVGEDSTIVVFGEFLRSADFKSGNYWFSRINSVTPFYMRRCRNWNMKGIIVHGGVDTTTKENVVEGGGDGLITQACVNYVVQDCTFRYCARDGIMIGINVKADRNVLFENVTCDHNARQGMSVIQARNVIAKQCKFLNTGRTGNYGGHSPRAGVDVEPDRQADILTGEIQYVSCTFSGNLGSQFVSAGGQGIEGITLLAPTIVSNTDSSQYAVILAVKDGLIDGGTADLSDNSIRPAWLEGSPVSNTTIRDMTIHSTGISILSAVDDMTVLVENNKIVSSQVGAGHIVYLTSTNSNTFRNNKIFISSSAWSGAKTWQQISLIENVIEANGNTWSTDLLPGTTIVDLVVSGTITPTLVPVTAFFCPAYDYSQSVTNEKFSVGMRPTRSHTSWDPQNTYTKPV